MVNLSWGKKAKQMHNSIPNKHNCGSVAVTFLQGAALEQGLHTKHYSLSFIYSLFGSGCLGHWTSKKGDFKY